MSELWDVFCEDLGKKGLRCNHTTLYLLLLIQECSNWSGQGHRRVNCPGGEDFCNLFSPKFTNVCVNSYELKMSSARFWNNQTSQKQTTLPFSINMHLDLQKLWWFNVDQRFSQIMFCVISTREALNHAMHHSRCAMSVFLEVQYHSPWDISLSQL